LVAREFVDERNIVGRRTRSTSAYAPAWIYREHAARSMNMSSLQKMGGIAALGHTAALVVGMVLSFTLMFPLLDAAPDQAMKFLASNQALVYLWTLIVDWGSAITLVIMLLALYKRLGPGSPALMQAAAVFGLLWAGLTIGADNLMLHNFGVVANLRGNTPAQAAAWTALVRSLWVLLLSLAAVRTGGLTRASGYLGVFLGIAGCLTMIPAFAETMFLIFGPGMMVWSAWVGIVMLRRSAAMTTQHDDKFVPRHHEQEMLPIP
jgi:hypothetical protein